MPRDGAGVYTLPIGNPVVTNTIIASTWANSTMSDIAAQLNNVLTRDGLLGPVGPFKIQDGTVAAPGLAFASEVGLGWYRSGAGRINTATAGQIVASFDASSATSTGVAISPRTVGASTFSVSRTPGSDVTTQYALAMTANSSGCALFESRGSGVPALPLVMNFPAGIDANSAVSFSVAQGCGFSHTGTNTFLGLGNGFGGFSFLFERANGKLTWLNSGGGNSFSVDGQNNMLVAGMITATGGGVSMLSDGVYNYLGMQSAQVGWSWRWHRAIGSLEWVNSSGVQLIGFDPSGNAAKSSGAGPWNGVSDARFKNVYGDYTSGLAELLKLVPKWYSYKDMPDIKRVSLIAQDVKPVMPEMITVGPIQRGDISLDDGMTFDMTNLTYATINAIKELHERLTHLESIPRTA